MSQPIEPRRPAVFDPTYARPEPWFVGSGRGLMIAVLSLVALVVALRGVTTWWALEDAWRWWQNRPDAVPLPPPVMVPDRPVASLPEPPIPPRDPRLASRPLSGNPGAAFGPDAYPAEALRGEQQGRVVARLEVGPNGVPRRCTVTTSSTYPTLDRTTCQIAMARVRYDPARDATGQAIAATTTLPVRWQLPDLPTP